MTRNQRRTASRRERFGFDNNTGGNRMFRRSVSVVRPRSIKRSRQQWNVAVNRATFD